MVHPVRKIYIWTLNGNRSKNSAVCLVRMKFKQNSTCAIQGGRAGAQVTIPQLNAQFKQRGWIRAVRKCELIPPFSKRLELCFFGRVKCFVNESWRSLRGMIRLETAGDEKQMARRVQVGEKGTSFFCVSSRGAFRCWEGRKV